MSEANRGATVRIKEITPYVSMDQGAIYPTLHLVKCTVQHTPARALRSCLVSPVWYPIVQYRL